MGDVTSLALAKQKSMPLNPSIASIPGDIFVLSFGPSNRINDWSRERVRLVRICRTVPLTHLIISILLESGNLFLRIHVV